MDKEVDAILNGIAESAARNRSNPTYGDSEETNFTMTCDVYARARALVEEEHPEDAHRVGMIAASGFVILSFRTGGYDDQFPK